MSITDELRERIDDEALLLSTRRELWNIADRIDAEHESMVSYWQGASYKDGYDEGFASADDWLAQHEDAMAEHGWIRLPLDSNGVPIRAGDMLDGYGKIIEVVEIRHGRSGWVVISRDGNGYADTFAFTHHRPPTVEDILREFALRAIRESEGNYGDLDETCAEYAKRLRLVGEGE